MKANRFFHFSKDVLHATVVLTAFLLFVNCEFAKRDDRIIFFINEEPIVYKSGVSMSQLFDSNGKLKYVVREDLRSLIPGRGTSINMNLVRSGRSIRKIRNANIMGTEILDIKELADNARPDDHIVIELIGLPKGLPQIVSIRFTE